MMEKKTDSWAFMMDEEDRIREEERRAKDRWRNKRGEDKRTWGERTPSISSNSRSPHRKRKTEEDLRNFLPDQKYSVEHRSYGSVYTPLEERRDNRSVYTRDSYNNENNDRNKRHTSNSKERTRDRSWYKDKSKNETTENDKNETKKDNSRKRDERSPRNCDRNTKEKPEEKSEKKRKYKIERETCEKKMKVRQNQIDIGKNTEGYKRYIEEVPRKDRTEDHPWTPDKTTARSTRSWHGVLRLWRRKLHYWDPLEVAQAEAEKFCNVQPEGFVVSKSLQENKIKEEIPSEEIKEEMLSEEIKEEMLSEDDELTTEELLFGAPVDDY